MILVTGATGTNGSAVVKLLSEHGAKVRALARDPGKASGLRLKGVEVVAGDYGDVGSLERAMRGVEKVFLLSPVSEKQTELEANVVNAAKGARVGHIIKFSVVHASGGSPARLVRWHHETEELIRSTGMAFTFLRPNMFMQELLRQTQSIKGAGQFYLPLADSRVSLTDVRDIAKVAATVLTQPGHDGKTYNITGPAALSFNDVAKELSQVCGKTVSYVPVSAQQFIDGFLQAGAPRWMADIVMELYGTFPGRNDQVFEGVREATGRAATSFAQFAKDHAGQFM